MTQVMSFVEAREHIMDGDIVFIKNRRGPLSSLIHVFTRSVYSHVGIAFWMKTGNVRRLMMVEAQGGTSRRIVNLSKYAGDDLDVIEAPQEWDSVVNTALKKLSEVPYGYFEALYVGIVEFAQQYWNITLPRKNFDGEICSEFVARVYDLPEKHISPQGLFEQLAKLGHNPAVQVKG